MLTSMVDDTERDNQPPHPSDHKPHLRPVEVLPHPDAEQQMVLLRDPSALADVTLSMSLPALHLLSLMDGEHTLEEIRAGFSQRFDQVLPPETLQELVQHLEQAHFLEGPAFEQFYSKLVSEYLDATVRPMNELRGMGLEEGNVADRLKQMFCWQKDGTPQRQVIGLIAPHLDYLRGQPCYLQAYSALAAQDHIKRFVILGTNHFGRSSAIVATGKDFETALGVSRVDVGFLEELERRCGASLRRYEFDHKREHSVELQVLLLQHLFGHDGFTIMPLLCPSPCGPAGTAPDDGVGVDLRDFALALGALIREDQTPTCVIAGADLSHVGRFFGDTNQLTEAFLKRVSDHDHAALQHVLANEAEKFLAQVSGDDNPTRICSAGCIYTLMTALPDAKARLLRYHQAVNHQMQCSVSCAAAVFQAP